MLSVCEELSDKISLPRVTNDEATVEEIGAEVGLKDRCDFFG